MNPRRKQTQATVFTHSHLGIAGRLVASPAAALRWVFGRRVVETVAHPGCSRHLEGGKVC